MNSALTRFYLDVRSLTRRLTSRNRPPRRMPAELAAEFTDNSRIPTLRWYLHDATSKPLHWSTRSPGWNPRAVANRKQRYYGNTDAYFYAALDDHDLRGKRVAVIGSESPWYECILTEFGARVTTIEFREIHCEIPGLTVLTPEEFDRDPKTFDAVVSISSIEHGGLGRYGDHINPRGDLESMDRIKPLLKPGGKLFLAVPVGPDAVVWNAHRIYGPIRLPQLLDGWETVDTYGFHESLFESPLGRWDQQPVWVLRPGSALKAAVPPANGEIRNA